jgi:Flp pilus assembly protein TadG
MATRAFAGFARHVQSEQGDALIESAVTIIFFFTVLFGILDFGRALYAYHFVSEAAREATRWAAVNGWHCTDDSSCTVPATDGDVQSYVSNLTPAGINKANVSTRACGTADGGECPESTSPACATPPDNDGCMVKVTVNYAFNFLVPLVHVGRVTLSSTSEMVISH